MGTRTPLFSRNQPGGLFSIADVPSHPGDIWFVHSGTGTDGAGYGQNPDAPCATVDYAIGLCTANKNDVIYVMPGHAETYTTTGAKVVADIAGISIIGLGNGADRPTFTFGHTTATWTISAAGVKLSNLLLVTSVDSVVTFATISGADCTLEDIETRDTTDVEVITDFTITGQRPVIKRMFKNGYTAGNANVRVLSLNAVDGARIEDCFFSTKVTTAVVGFVTAPCSDVVIKDSVFLVTSTTDFSKDIVDTISGSTWAASGCFDLAAGSGFSGGSGAALAGDDVSSVTADTTLIKSVLYGADGVASYPTAAAYANGVSLAEVIAYIQNAVRNGSGTAMGTNKGVADALGSNGLAVVDSAVSVLGAIGADNADNAFASTAIVANGDGSVLERLEHVQGGVRNGSGTAMGTNKSVADALGTNGTAVVDSAVSVLGAIGADNADNAFASTSIVANKDGSVLERLEYIQDGAGTEFTISKSVVQSAVVAAGAALTGASSGGALELVSVHIQNGSTAADSTGHASTVALYTNNVAGSASFLTAAQALLAANAVVSMANATTNTGGVVLETGKIVSIKATGEDLTSAGTMVVYLTFKRIAAGATVAAA